MRRSLFLAVQRPPPTNLWSEQHDGRRRSCRCATAPTHTWWRAPKIWAPFSPCFRHPDSIIPRNSRTDEGGSNRNQHEKHQISGLFFGSKMLLNVKNNHKTGFLTHCTLMHMTDSMTPVRAPQHHFPQNHESVQAFSQHGAIRRGAFRHGAHGPSPWQPEDRGSAWCAAVDNAALAAEAALGWRHGVAQHRATTRRGGRPVCLVFFACFVSHLSNCT